ncbi:MAG TPA: hypothetical protein VN610_01015, partial [Bryobacteraceae bacterium]|nr:hypothetical protein [Bryobacteraceae bacterium]
MKIASGRGAGEDLVKPPRDDQILAWFQHPNADNDSVAIRGESGARFIASRGRIELDEGTAFPQFGGNVARGDLDTLLIISNQQVGNMIRDRRDEDACGERRNALEVTGDYGRAALELGFHGSVGLAEEP